MACGGTVLSQLKGIVGQIDDCCPPCCGASGGFSCAGGYEGPFATVTMVCPPPILAPTSPQPVKPLQLPCAGQTPEMSEEKAVKLRYSNFYNNYNVDWHTDQSSQSNDCPPSCTFQKQKGVTMDGRSPCCEDYRRKPRQTSSPMPGCPTGFKPCTMKLSPPPGCHPMGVWTAHVQPCPPKSAKNKVSVTYEPGPCTRPCCKHWKPKEGPCLYDEPCIAHCFNHPPGIKPRKSV